MTYGFAIRRNPRAVLLVLIPIVLLAASVVLILVVNPILGLVVMGLSAYISYHLLKFLRLHIKSAVRTYDEELVCETTTGEKVQFDWSSITLAGRYLVQNEPDLLFVYNETEDKLLSIPFHYSQMGKLENEIQDHVGQMLDLSGEREGLVDCLKEHLGIAEEDDE